MSYNSINPEIEFNADSSNDDISDQEMEILKKEVEEEKVLKIKPLKKVKA